VPETPVKAVSEHGDIWELGGHRLACGDATEAHTVEALLGGVEPSLMVTDPPYGVEYKPANRGTGQEGWERAQGIVLNDDRSDWREVWALFPGPVAYVWHAMKTADTVLESLRAVEFTLSSQIVWRKTSPVMSPANRTTSGSYNPQHECCYYVVRKGSKAGWKGDRSQSTVWDIDHLKNETGHGTQKPVECMSRPIINNSSPGQAVYDPFVGSGTTIIACEQTDRVAYACELNPAYCDVAITRWQKFSGKVAILMETGETFTEVMARRHPDTPTPERAVRKPKGGKK
jgi:DNA modification methylase